MSNFFSDPQAQTVSINDFTPGIVRFSRGSYPVVYPSGAPLGAAATAVRCYAVPGVGLVPFPTYSQVQSFSLAGTAGAQWLLSIAGMQSLAANFDDSLVTYFIGVAGTNTGGTITITVKITRLAIPTRAGIGSATPTTVFSNTRSGTGTSNELTDWPAMDIGEFESGGTFARCVITSAFNASIQPIWVSIPDWASTADQNSGLLPAPAFEAPRVFYHAARMGVLQSPFGTTAGGFVSCNGDILDVSTTPLVLQPFTQSGVFFGELGSVIGTWGSMSTGEFFALYTQGGAMMFYGDLLAPTQVIKLPGVVGPGNVLGKAALASSGLVYATEADGVYAWDGGNTASKISGQVPDDVFTRTRPPSTFGLDDHMNASQAAWGQWIMFPNNWVYDQTTKSWWNCEDPAVINFQVHTPSVSQEFFHSAPGFVSAADGTNPLALATYRWDKYTPASTYTWVSNPIPQSVGALISLQEIELVASNPNGSPATVTITPTVPAGQTALPQQNPAQGQTFTIPAATSNWRGALRYGYTDYNIQLEVDAHGPGGAAPTVHAINIGYTTTRVSGVQ